MNSQNPHDYHSEIISVQNLDTDSQEQQFKQQQRQLRTIVDQKVKKKKLIEKIIVGSKLHSDISDFFQFKKTLRLSGNVKQKLQQQSIVQQFTSDYLAWFVLMYTLINSALIPCWIAPLKSVKFQKNSWLFLMKTIILIPFIIYQKRTCKPQFREKYSFKYIFNKKYLKKIILSASSTSISLFFIWMTLQWTFISHSLILCGLSNFFLSLIRTKNGQNHKLQPGGQIMVIFGVLLMFYQVSTMQVETLPQHYQYLSISYLGRTNFQRLIADILAFCGSYIIAQFSRETAKAKDQFPPFLSLFLATILIFINMMLAGFFFVGSQFSTINKFGYFSLFSLANTSFFVISIVLSLGIFIPYVLVSKLYPTPTIPSMVLVFEPFVSGFFLHITGVQHLPQTFSSFGFLFIVPGMMIILVGQHIYIHTIKKQSSNESIKLSKFLQQKQKRRLARLQSKRQLESKKQISLKKLKLSDLQYQNQLLQVIKIKSEE